MTNDTQGIAPALTAEEWDGLYTDGIELHGTPEPYRHGQVVSSGFEFHATRRAAVHPDPTEKFPSYIEEQGIVYVNEASLVIDSDPRIDATHASAAIAVLNDILPDDDPRKITREMVDIIREAGKRIGREGNPYLGFEANLLRFADALESLLPPDTH